MRILADENVQAAIVLWLRGIGHDVVWAAEEFSACEDLSILEHANSTGRIVLTRDKDFGSLVFRDHRASHGVILLRIAARNQVERLEILKCLWHKAESNARGHFVVVDNERVRVRRLGSLQ